MLSLLLAAEIAKLGAAVGAGLAAIGAGIGIGRIGGFRDIYNFPIRVGCTDAIHALKYTFRLAYVFGSESDIFTCCRVDTF